jgi:hypothetical protein
LGLCSDSAEERRILRGISFVLPKNKGRIVNDPALAALKAYNINFKASYSSVEPSFD